MNKNYNKRDNIIFGENYNKEKYLGGVRYFEQMTRKTLKQLLADGFIESDECQNCSPTTEEFLKETEGFDDYVLFEGYTVSPERDDYRITIDAVIIKIPYHEHDALSRFVEAYQGADEFSLSPDNSQKTYILRAWWD